MKSEQGQTEDIEEAAALIDARVKNEYREGTMRGSNVQPSMLSTVICGRVRSMLLKKVGT